MRALTLFLLAASLATAQQEFQVVLKKSLRPDQEGMLRVSDAGVCFAPKGDGENPRCWDYVDIQHLDRLSPTQIKLLSYEDVAWKLGRDRGYLFELLAGELPDALFDGMAERIGKPVTDRLVQEPSEAAEAIPAKHLKTLGGSEGRVYISPERILYLTEASEQSREWRLEREVASVWSSDPYRLEVHVYEGATGASRQPKVYKFSLKSPLDPELYRRLKLRLYEIDRERGLNP